MTVRWLSDAVDCLKSSLKNSMAKVKWNACYATGSLASNASLREQIRSDGSLAQLNELLVYLINENPNFKVQMQAAAALENIPERALFEDTFFPAVSAISRRLQILQDGSPGIQNEDGAEITLIQPMVDASFPNFRYHQGLKNQLERTLLHLLTLLDGPFSTTCTFPRPDILFSWLKRRVEETIRSSFGSHSDNSTQLRAVVLRLIEHESNLADWKSLQMALDDAKSNPVAG